jgi:hypothetical protein
LRAERLPRGLFGVVAVIALLAVSVSACDSSGPTPTSMYTTYPLGATPWPNGTTGQYGLRIDPSMLKRLPIAVGGIELTEDAGTEAVELDDAGIASTVDTFAAAMANDIGAADWLKVEIVHFKPDSQNGDVYGQWIDDYAFQACSQAGGVGDSSTETINNWVVDAAICNEGVNVYTLSLGNGQYLSMFGLGPKDLGRLLISNLF